MNNLIGVLDNIRSTDLDAMFSKIKAHVEQCEKQRDSALKQVEEWNKDEEIQKIKSEMENMQKERFVSVTFAISPQELDAIEAWKNRHVKEKHNGNAYAGAIGGRYSYKFCPTSIGDVGEVICSCGEKFCFRDLD